MKAYKVLISKFNLRFTFDFFVIGLVFLIITNHIFNYYFLDFFLSYINQNDGLEILDDDNNNFGFRLDKNHIMMILNNERKIDDVFLLKTIYNTKFENQILILSLINKYLLIIFTSIGYLFSIFLSVLKMKQKIWQNGNDELNNVKCN